MTARPKPAAPTHTADDATVAPEPVHAGAQWREHDLMIRRFHNAALAPDEIAVVLNSKGLKVRTWHVSETFVRNRLKALGLAPHASRLYYMQGENRYRRR
jgi:hypothetical protein